VSHALIDRLCSDLGYVQVSLENHDEFVRAPGLNVLFFPGDPQTVNDATDVAVVLPELVQAFSGRLTPGVVTDTFGDGTTLKRQYGFQRYPALVFVRDGEHVTSIERIRDWAEYLTRISGLLETASAASPSAKTSAGHV